MTSSLNKLSPLKSPQQITGALIKTLVAGELGVKPQQIFSVSVTPCTAMKFEARRDAMMRKGISDVDSVLTVREIARLIRLFGIDISTTEGEPADEPMDMRSSAAALAEVSGGLTEGVIREMLYESEKKELDKNLFKKLRSSGNFREASFSIGNREIKVAVVDGLTGLEKLNISVSAGADYDLVEVMVCQGGCVHGAGLSFCSNRDQIKNRAKTTYQLEENEAVSIPSKSPSLLNHYQKDPVDRSIFLTHFSKRDVLL
jgi:iron only hydrogenase large subunit-like protein